MAVESILLLISSTVSAQRLCVLSFEFQSSIAHSAPMQTSSSSRAPAARSRPLSTRGFASSPSRSEAYPYAVPQQRLRDKTITTAAPEAKAPYKGLQLTTTKQKYSGGGSFSAVSGNSGRYTLSLSPTSKPKPSTISSRPTSQGSKRHNVTAKISGNATRTPTSVPLAQKQVPKQQELGPDNWTLITAEVLASTPPPRMKIHRHRRATILAKDGTTALFSKVQSPSNQEYMDVFHDRKCGPSPSLSDAPPKTLSPHTPPANLLVSDISPEPAPRPLRTKSAFSLPSRHLKRRTRAISKTVTWDPSIVSIGPGLSPTLEDAAEKGQEEVQISNAPNQALKYKLDVKDCVETIKEWGKTDRLKLVTLIEALKQLDLGSADRENISMYAQSSNGRDEEVLITTVKSMDPRVPEFESSRITKAKNRTFRSGELEKHSTVKLDLDVLSDTDCNKENIPEVPLLLRATSRDNEVPRIKKRITILDDYDSSGREVDSFADWYAEMQLREFAKKYPLTGRRASAVRHAANISTKFAKISGDVRSVLGASETVTREFESSIIRGGNVPSLREIHKTGRRETGNGVARKDGGDGSARRQHMRPRRCCMPPMNDLSARNDAAIIQQRLEVLLLKDKERKAFEGIPEAAKMSVRYVDCGAMTGSENHFYGGSTHEGSYPMSGPLWIPSERLKL
jgi:hypothetical protein